MESQWPPIVSVNYVRSICHSLCKRIPRIVRIVFAGISSNCVTRSNKFRFSPKRFHPNSSFRAQKFFSLPRIEFSSFSTKFRSNESRKIRSRFLSCVVRIVASYFTQSEPSKAAADIGRLPSITKKQLVELYKRDCRRGRPPRGIRIYHGSVNRSLIRRLPGSGAEEHTRRGLSSAWFTIEVFKPRPSPPRAKRSLHKMLLNPAPSKSISAVNSPLFRANFAYPYTRTSTREEEEGVRRAPSLFFSRSRVRSRFTFVSSNGKYLSPIPANGTLYVHCRWNLSRRTVRICNCNCYC